MNDFLDLPNWAKPNQPKRMSLQELQEERKRLVEITRINKLKLQQSKQLEQNKANYDLERKQKIEALKKVGGGIANVFKAGGQKISAFEQSRLKAKPIIPNLPKQNKSIYKD